MNLAKYKTLIFDCDGVLLDSNRIKTEAFRWAASPYGEAAASELVAHHIANGGVSRYVKFERFLNEVAPKYQCERGGAENLPDLNALTERFARAVKDGLTNCPVAPGLAEFRAAVNSSRWMVVSGGDQTELREVFRLRDLDHYFDRGIFGSPDTKDEILTREMKSRGIKLPALFIGDSRLDHEAARRAGIDFVFIYGWTDFADWRTYLERHDIDAFENLNELRRHAL